MQAANSIGVPVFNAPFSNTRSVAEMVICEVIALARKLGDRSSEVHRWGRRRTSSRTSADRPRLVDIQLFSAMLIYCIFFQKPRGLSGSPGGQGSLHSLVSSCEV